MIRATFQPKTFQLALLVILTGLMLAAGLGLISPPTLLPGLEARAAGTISVTTTTDEFNTGGSGSGCSLREAVESINTSTSFGGCSNPGNADTIQLQAMVYPLSIPETSMPFDNAEGSLKLGKSMNIQGVDSEQTIITTTATFNQSVLELSATSANTVIAIERVNIQGGKRSPNLIWNSLALGIYLYLSGTNSTLILIDAVVENNPGGGIYGISGDLNLDNVTIRNNGSTDGFAGGLEQTSGNTILNNVTLYGNQAFQGGAIYMINYSPGPTGNKLQMTNVTIFDNQAEGSGGGLYLDFSGYGNIVTGTNVTIANNRALSGSGGNIYNNASALSLKNTIITSGLANGSANNCGGNPVPNITSLGYNLDSGNTCGLTATGDITNTNPLLTASLADNGGATETLALLTGSPAINNGTCSGAPLTDQRGVVRPQGTACDIGAYEAETQGGATSYWVHLPLIWKN